MNKSLQAWGIAFLLLIFSFQALYLAKTNSTVSDEVAHIAAGYGYVKHHTFKLNPEHPPLVKQIAALPLVFMDLKFPLNDAAWEGDGEQWKAGRLFLYGLGNSAEKIIFSARAALLPLAWILGLFLFSWTRSLFGVPAAFFSLFLFAFFPDFIIHSSLVTTDFGLAVFFFASFRMLALYYETGRFRDLFLAGILGGLAAVSKYSAVMLLPLFYASAVFLYFQGRALNLPKKIPLWILVPAFICIVSQRQAFYIISLPLVYVCLQWVLPKWRALENEKLRSILLMAFVLIGAALLVALIDYFEPLNWFHTFRPFKRFFRGWTIFRDHAHFGNHPAFLFGQISQTGWPYYFPVAMFFKVPLPILIFSLLGMLFALFKRAFLRPSSVFLWVPPLFYLLISCFANKVNIGVRHVLPLYPFALVLAGGAFKNLLDRKKTWAYAFCFLLSNWLIAGSLGSFPNYLSYFNETAALAGGKEKILGDSNISWGQDLRRLRDYVRENNITELHGSIYFNFPEEIAYYKIPLINNADGLKTHVPGTYVVDVFSYQGMMQDPAYAWLKDRKPDARVGGSLLIYKI